MTKHLHLKPRLLALIITLFMSVGTSLAQFTLTVCNNNMNMRDERIPITGFHCNKYGKQEFVFPASMLSSMTNRQITAVKFYSDKTSVSYGAASFQVFLKEVGSIWVTDYQGTDGATIVYEGSLSVTNGKLNIQFTTPYIYQGGNLLIGVYNPVKGSSETTYFYGRPTYDSSIAGWDSNSLNNITASNSQFPDFLPKTTFSFSFYYIDGEITASVSPDGSGTVSGTGTFTGGSTCTLEATANEGYAFLNWTENGNVVSTNASYSFIVNGDRALVANFAPFITQGSVGGHAFKVNHNGDQVLFSQGNLQYIGSASTPYWKFAEHQWDYLGDNGQGSTNTNVDRDLFGWGTSGYDHGAVCYQPWSTSTTSSDYYAYGSDTCNLYDQTGQADWGYNAISNGGNTENCGWRTLTKDEWVYLFNHRSGKRYAKAQVNGVNGVILLPDDWSSSYYTLNNTNSTSANFTSNTITASQWNTLEQHGAVFLPAADSRNGTSVGTIGTEGYYWSASYTESGEANGVHFNNGYFQPSYGMYRYCGRSVRLVAPGEHFSFGISAMPNPAEGGTVSGVGTYAWGTDCTLTAVPSAGYAFINWTENGDVVSTAASYTFTVLGERNLVANFALIYSISAMPNPAEGGTVSGVGTYAWGADCTLTAVPSAGYAFINWTENGVVVSTNSEYTFTVTSERNLVANFGSSLTVYDGTMTDERVPITGWHVDKYGKCEYIFPQSSILSMVGTAITSMKCYSSSSSKTFGNAIYRVFMKTVSSTTLNDYYGESGATVVYEGSLSVSNGVLEIEFTTAYSYSGGHLLIGVYQIVRGNGHNTCRFYGQTVNGASLVGWNSTSLNNIHGSNSEHPNFLPKTTFTYCNFNTITQTTNFNNGWNWWSSYIELDGVNSLQSLQNGLGTSGEMIKSQNNGYASYLAGYGWYGSLTTINNENSYQIRANEPCSVEMTSAMANPFDHPITLNTGWTWVGYPVAVSMGVSEAFSGIAPQSGDMLKSQNNGFASYLDGFGWYGSLSILQPGMGLMYKSNNGSAVTLVYPNDGTRTDLKANQTADNNHWQPNLNAYPDNMSVMAVVEIDGEELALRQAQGPDNYELAVFANGECRGSARLMYVEPLNRYMAFLTVAGDEAAELRFGLYNTETGEVETQCITSLQYETNAVIGSFAEPYVVRFRGTTGVDEWANSLNVFPNPVERGQKVSLGFNDVEMGEVQVEIINVLGAIVETRRAASLQTITVPETAGVYTLRITVEGKGTCYRKLVVE